jgi:hypothetical protein
MHIIRYASCDMRLFSCIWYTRIMQNNRLNHYLRICISTWSASHPYHIDTHQIKSAYQRWYPDQISMYLGDAYDTQPLSSRLWNFFKINCLCNIMDVINIFWWIFKVVIRLFILLLFATNFWSKSLKSIKLIGSEDIIFSIFCFLWIISNY